MSSDTGWCTIESDPGVFTELLSSIGVRNIQVEELYSLDRSLFPTHAKIHGLVFLFKYEKTSSDFPPAGPVISPPPSSLFFANQTIQNACATQAILSIVMNTSDLDIGPELTRFREFTTGMDPVTTGMVIGNSDIIREAHNSFRAPQQFIVEESDNEQKEDPFHFVAYIPHQGHVYELDGLQQGPLDLGALPEKGKDWIDVVTPIISARMEQYNKLGGNEIRFNLMMVIEDPRERLRKEIDQLKNTQGDSADVSMLEHQIILEDEKHAKWKTENIRRRHNFGPFIIAFLKSLATTGHADRIIHSATDRKKTAYQQYLNKENEAKAKPK